MFANKGNPILCGRAGCSRTINHTGDHASVHMTLHGIAASPQGHPVERLDEMSADFRINQEDDGLHVAAQTTNASNLLRECGYSAWEAVVGPHEGRVLLEIIEERGLTVSSSPILDMSPRWTNGWANENKPDDDEVILPSKVGRVL